MSTLIGTAPELFNGRRGYRDLRMRLWLCHDFVAQVVGWYPEKIRLEIFRGHDLSVGSDSIFLSLQHTRRAINEPKLVFWGKGHAVPKQDMFLPLSDWLVRSRIVDKPGLVIVTAQITPQIYTGQAAAQKRLAS